jgi:hypothetical protein
MHFKKKYERTMKFNKVGYQYKKKTTDAFHKNRDNYMKEHARNCFVPRGKYLFQRNVFYAGISRNSDFLG